MERMRRPRSPAATTTPSPTTTACRLTGGSSLGKSTTMLVQVMPSRLRQHVLRSPVVTNMGVPPTLPKATARRLVAVVAFGVQRLPSLLTSMGPAPTATQMPLP
jgi:hypothetical protein